MEQWSVATSLNPLSEEEMTLKRDKSLNNEEYFRFGFRISVKYVNKPPNLSLSSWMMNTLEMLPIQLVQSCTSAPMSSPSLLSSPYC